MVSTQKCDAVGPFGFENQQIGERLQAVISSVNKVSLHMTQVIHQYHVRSSHAQHALRCSFESFQCTNHKYVVCVWNLAASSEEFTKVIKLRHKVIEVGEDITFQQIKLYYIDLL